MIKTWSKKRVLNRNSNLASVLRTLVGVSLLAPLLALAMSPAPVTGAIDSTENQQSWWLGAEDEGGDVALYRSVADQRAYRYLQLDNQLKVLLISDPDSDKSAASLDVHVGSFQNPSDREGLAHFLEHMLFLGTDKYPEPGAYQAFISEHGGSHNAYTSLEHTNYFFDIAPASLDAALDRFAQFFIAPRFDATYVDRERKAVESEFRLKIKDDGRREWEVLSELVNPEHPQSKFTVGSIETLADREQDWVRDDLLAFYQQYYSANLMTLAVLGKESLDQLQAMVETRFGEIKNHHSAIPETPIALLQGESHNEVRISPEKERRELGFLFPLQNLQQYWRTKPAAFLGHLLGDESERSLLSELKRRGWAEGLSAGTMYDSRYGAAFAMNIALTPLGVQHYQQVQEASFAWINLVKRDGVQGWRYREIAELADVDFRFLEKSPAASYVRTVAAAMHDYPAEEVLRGPFDYQQFDDKVIREVAEKLRADNALVTLVAPEFKSLALRSERYQAPYSVQTIPAERIASWNKMGNKTASETGSELMEQPLGLPAPNPYLAKNFPVSGRGGEAGIPQKIVDTDALTLWYYLDTQFASPRSTFNAKILMPSVGSREGAALTSLYLAMVRDQLNAETYPALLAGLGFNVQRWSHGIALSVSGYSDKQQVLLARVLEVLAAPEWDEQRFTRVKTQLIREWKNSRKQWPVRQVFGEVAPLLSEGYRPLELADTLLPVDLPALKTFVASVYQHNQVEAYAGGVLQADTAKAMAKSVLESLGIQGSANAVSEVLIDDKQQNQTAVYRVLKLAPSANPSHRSIAVDHADSSAVLYLQAAADTLDARAQFALLQKIIEAPFYTALRTEKQLGYVVGNRTMSMRRVPGLALYVQSSVRGSAELVSEIDAFLESQQSIVESMSEEDFVRYQQSVLSVLEEDPKNLLELAGRHLESLALDFEQFDFRERFAAAIKSVSREQLINAYNELLGETRRGLWLSTRDKASSTAEAAIEVTAETLSERNKVEVYSYPAL